MDEKLLPCPFCGGEAQRINVTEEDGEYNAGGSFIHCPACLASSKIVFGEKVGLKEAWNRRPGDNISESVRKDMLSVLPADKAETLDKAHLMDVWMVTYADLRAEVERLRGDRLSLMLEFSNYLHCGLPDLVNGHPQGMMELLPDGRGLWLSKPQTDEIVRGFLAALAASEPREVKP